MSALEVDLMHHPYGIVNHEHDQTYQIKKSYSHHAAASSSSSSHLMTSSPEQFNWFTSGDLSAFVALVTNNMATLLFVVTSLAPLGDDIVFGRIVPGVGWATLFGNLYYSWMAWRLRRSDQRNDVCAQPYGINTPGAFAFAGLIIMPAFTACLESNEFTLPECQERSWQIGIGANFISAIILLFGSMIGRWISRNVALVPLFTSLSSIAVAFLCFNSLFDVFAYPIVGFFCIGILFAEFFGGIKFSIPIPGFNRSVPMPAAIIILVLGAAIGWADGMVHGSAIKESGSLIKAYAPVFTLVGMFKHIDLVKSSLSIIIPTAITVAIGTIQCVQTAHEAGDQYSVRDSMIGDGVGTLIGAVTGSPLGMTVYIGHPGFKRMGARAGYSLASAIVFWILCVFGFLAPLNNMIVAAAVNPILIAIGFDITSETIKITPHRHIPAVIFGLLPSFANWGQTQQIENVGLNALGNGSLLVSMFITAIFIHLIDRNYRSIIYWSIFASILSFFGLIHSSEVGWLVKSTDISWRFAIAYLMLATLAGIAYMMQSRGKIEPMLPEAIQEQIEKEKRSYEQEQAGQVVQPNFCCACI